MIGIDEVGRGAWAGPLLIVAARERIELPDGLDDSKRLSREKRDILAPLIEESCDLGEGWVSAREVDKIGLTEAMRLGVLRALMAIEAKPDEIIIMDGSINYCALKYREVQTIVGADAAYPIVSAASIWAKVRRDTLMSNLDEKYLRYEFHKHVGYGTAHHKYLLLEYGVSDIHRHSYKPIAVMLKAESQAKRLS